MGTDPKGSPAEAPPRPAEPKYDLLEELAATILEAAKTLTAALEGRVTLAQLEARLPVLPADGHHPKRKADAPDNRIGNPLPPPGH